MSYQHTHRHNTAQCVAVVVAGKTPRNDLCGVSLHMPACEAAKFRTFMTNDPLFVMEQTLQTKDPTPLNPTSGPWEKLQDLVDVVDADSLALFLDSLREHGEVVTRSTAQVLAAKLASGQIALLEECILKGLVLVEGELCRLSPKGQQFLKDSMTPATVATPQQRFEDLREAVRQCRANLEDQRHGHGLVTVLRNNLTREIETAAKLEQSALRDLEDWRARVATAEKHHGQCRAQVLNLEAQLRDLPPDRSGDIAQAQSALEAAEKAYQEFIQI